MANHDSQPKDLGRTPVCSVTAVYVTSFHRQPSSHRVYVTSFHRQPSSQRYTDRRFNTECECSVCTHAHRRAALQINRPVGLCSHCTITHTTSCQPLPSIRQIPTPLPDEHKCNHTHTRARPSTRVNPRAYVCADTPHLQHAPHIHTSTRTHIIMLALSQTRIYKE